MNNFKSLLPTIVQLVLQDWQIPTQYVMVCSSLLMMVNWPEETMLSIAVCVMILTWTKSWWMVWLSQWFSFLSMLVPKTEQPWQWSTTDRTQTFQLLFALRSLPLHLTRDVQQGLLLRTKKEIDGVEVCPHGDGGVMLSAHKSIDVWLQRQVYKRVGIMVSEVFVHNQQYVILSEHAYRTLWKLTYCNHVLWQSGMTKETSLRQKEDSSDFLSDFAYQTVRARVGKVFDHIQLCNLFFLVDRIPSPGLYVVNDHCWVLVRQRIHTKKNPDPQKPDLPTENTSLDMICLWDKEFEDVENESIPPKVANVMELDEENTYLFCTSHVHGFFIDSEWSRQYPHLAAWVDKHPKGDIHQKGMNIYCPPTTHGVDWIILSGESTSAMDVYIEALMDEESAKRKLLYQLEWDYVERGHTLNEILKQQFLQNKPIHVEDIRRYDDTFALREEWKYYFIRNVLQNKDILFHTTLEEYVTDHTHLIQQLATKKHQRQERFVGYLAYGPPGCGKSLFAQLMAIAMGTHLVVIPASKLTCFRECKELLTQGGFTCRGRGYTNETLREFQVYTSANPHLVYLIDEIDQIPSLELLPHLQSLFDSLAVGNRLTVVIATTNHVDVLPPALYRSCRLSKLKFDVIQPSNVHAHWKAVWGPSVALPPSLEHLASTNPWSPADLRSMAKMHPSPEDVLALWTQGEQPSKM